MLLLNLEVILLAHVLFFALKQCINTAEIFTHINMISQLQVNSWEIEIWGEKKNNKWILYKKMFSL